GNRYCSSPARLFGLSALLQFRTARFLYSGFAVAAQLRSHCDARYCCDCRSSRYRESTRRQAIYFQAPWCDTELYDATGQLRTITHRNAITETFVYSDSATPGAPKAGLLVQVTDSIGRSLGFTYDAQARIIKVLDQAGQSYLYGYDQADNLATVTYPDLAHRQYLYNEMAHIQNANAPWLLTGIIDENGERFATFSYDAKGRAIATEHAGGVDRYQFSYAGAIPAVSTMVTDPLGTQRKYDYSYLNSHYTNTALSQPCVACGGTSGRSITYDKNSNATAITDFNGIKTTFAFDLTRNL